MACQKSHSTRKKEKKQVLFAYAPGNRRGGCVAVWQLDGEASSGLTRVLVHFDAGRPIGTGEASQISVLVVMALTAVRDRGEANRLDCDGEENVEMA